MVSNFVVIPFQIDGDDYHYEKVKLSIYRPFPIYGEIESYEIGFAGGEKKGKMGEWVYISNDVRKRDDICYQ